MKRFTRLVWKNRFNFQPDEKNRAGRDGPARSDYPRSLRSERNDFRRGNRTRRNFDAQHFGLARCIGKNAVRFAFGYQQRMVPIDHGIDAVEVNGCPTLDDVEDVFLNILGFPERGFIARSEGDQGASNSAL